ncbi:MAG: glycoside hydrolase family 140 protein [Armatimonadota bacterium]|nr:glycoside hydrolase family 140 protein [Armatimonadota bacterium]
MTLKISDNQRFLVHEDGRPFFYLGDTAWELFHRLTKGEASEYLRDRAAKRFTVVQAVALAEFAGLTEPNAEGHLPLRDNDPARPDEAYFAHIDWVVQQANALGLYVGFLPTWGDKWNKAWGQGPEIFTPDNARIYGKFLGARYQDADVIWILGGDRSVDTPAQFAIIRAMADGLKEGDCGRHLMTFHPPGGQGSAQYFHGEDWLGFNMRQTGHVRNRDSYAQIAEDYAGTPIKPCLDGEPCYEDHPAGFDLNNGYLDDYETRKAAYWALFAGACGHTYGCHAIWQFLSPARPAVNWARTVWRQALHLPGASQMRHARALLESRPFLSRLPDQSLLLSEIGIGTDHVQATRASDGAYAFVYVPSGKPVQVDPAALAGERLTAYWFDPRTGVAEKIGAFARADLPTFTPPTIGPDWVLVLDDASRHFAAPGYNGA